MRESDWTWPRPRINISVVKSTCFVKNWLLAKVNVPGMKSTSKRVEKRLNFKIKTTRLLSKLLKRPRTISLLCRPKLKMNAESLRRRFKNCRLNSMSQVTISNMTIRRLTKIKKLKLIQKETIFQIQLLFWNADFSKLLRLTKKRESLWTNICVTWRLLKMHLIKSSRPLAFQTLKK